MPGNLLAFVCKLSFQRGGEGYVSFIAKTKPIDHYIESLGAVHFGGHLMVITTQVALKLINKYFLNHNDMGLIREPLDIDFVVDPRPLTKKEELAISAFIKADKEKRALLEKRPGRTKSSSKTKATA